MTARSQHRGHPIEYDDANQEWLYTPEMAGSGQRGICAHCGLGPTEDGRDGCLGTLPERIVMNACCGHGNTSQAYIQYWGGSCIRGRIAVFEQRRMIEEGL